jgi:hypothetical protein
MVEPGIYATEWAGSSAKRASGLPAYAGVHAEAHRRCWMNQATPVLPPPALLTIVDTQSPPLRALFGVAPLGIVRSVYTERLNAWGVAARRCLGACLGIIAVRAGDETDASATVVRWRHNTRRRSITKARCVRVVRARHDRHQRADPGSTGELQLRRLGQSAAPASSAASLT